MTEKGLVAVTTGLVLSIGGACSPAPAHRAALIARSLSGSNVLLVTIDTLRRDRVGAYGSTSGLTPALDRLAASGVRFTHAYTHAPMTLPAHASILTGRTPIRHAVRANGTYRLPDDVPTLATVLEAAGYRNGAFVGAFVLDERYGLSHGFAEYDDRFVRSPRTTFAFAERRAADVVRAAGDWILSATEPAPWLAWVHLFDPHAPYEAPETFHQARTPYDAEVAYTDAMIASLLDRLRAAKALDRTLVVVTADHGESLGDHGETTHGLFAYEATLAVPLIVSGPGIAAGVIDDAVGHFDLLPTICDLLGIAPPAALDGRSLTSAPPADRLVYFEALDAALTRGWAPLSGVVSGAWKFIDLPEPELYDLTADPGEVHNLATRDAARVADLSDARTAFVAEASSRAAPSATATLDEDAARRLRSLGYVAGRQGRAASSETGTVGSNGGRFAAQDDPKRLVALNERFNTALSAFNRGQASESLAGFRAVLSERPDFLTARSSAATVLIATGHASDAVTLLREAPADQASTPELLAKLGVALREAGDFTAAASALESARAGGTQNPEVANDLGVVYARLGRPRDARALFEESLQRDPDDAATWNNLGVLELSSGRPRGAAVAFRHAVDADDTRGDAWQGLGAALVGHDRPGAIEAWRQAERLLPRDYDLLFNLGMVLAESPRPRESLTYLERFVREAPRDRYASDIARVEAVIRQVSK